MRGPRKRIKSFVTVKRSGTGVSPVCRFHDSHGRDTRATTLEAPWPTQFRLPQTTKHAQQIHAHAKPAPVGRSLAPSGWTGSLSIMFEPSVDARHERGGPCP